MLRYNKPKGESEVAVEDQVEVPEDGIGECDYCGDRLIGPTVQITNKRAMHQSCWAQYREELRK